MDKREIVNQSITNMEMFYKDIGRIIKVIEEQMLNKKYKALGNAAVTWENSTSLNNSEMWLPVWFARVYSKTNTSTRAIGFCIHLGGERYMDTDNNDVINEMGIKLPIMSVSVLEAGGAISKVNRTVLYDSLWDAGFGAENMTIKEKVIITSEPEIYEEKFKAVTYFVDIFSLTNGDIINNLVVNPMDNMYKKNEDYIIESKIPAVEINTLIDESDKTC